MRDTSVKVEISDDTGTAVNIQAMVFGNMGGDSATGVATQSKQVKTFLVSGPNAQGEMLLQEHIPHCH